MRSPRGPAHAVAMFRRLSAVHCARRVPSPCIVMVRAAEPSRRHQRIARRNWSAVVCSVSSGVNLVAAVAVVGAGRRPHTPRRGIPSPRPLKRRAGQCPPPGDPGASGSRCAPRGGQRTGGAERQTTGDERRMITTAPPPALSRSSPRTFALHRRGARSRTISPPSAHSPPQLVCCRLLCVLCGESSSFCCPPRSGIAADRSLPGADQSLPGADRSLPGADRSLPGADRSLPGADQPLPGADQPLPGADQPLPGADQSLPGADRSFLLAIPAARLAYRSV